MKKILLLALIVLMLLSFAGCCLPYRMGTRFDNSSNYEQIITSEELTIQQDSDVSVPSSDNTNSEIISSDDTTASIDSEPSFTLDNIKRQIVGTWSHARREEASINTSEYVFNADGTFTEHFHKYMPRAVIYNDESETGWEDAPMGFPTYEGTYEIREPVNDCVTVILSYTFDGFESLVNPEVKKFTIFNFTDSSMKFSEINYDPQLFYKNVEDTSFEGLCTTFNIDITT